MKSNPTPASSRCVKHLLRLSRGAILLCGLVGTVTSVFGQFPVTVTFHNVSDCTITGVGESGTTVASVNNMGPQSVYVDYAGNTGYAGSPVTWSGVPNTGPGGAWGPSYVYPSEAIDVYLWCDSPGYGPLDDASDFGGGPSSCTGGGGGPGPAGPGPGSAAPPGPPLAPPDSPPLTTGTPSPLAYGMPIWRVSEPNISLWLLDEPLGYQPCVGSRIALRLGYKQRESTAGMATNIFSLGQKWNFSWLSYVTLNYNGSNVVCFPGGGIRTFTGTNDYLTDTILTGSMTNRYYLSYPDGSVDTYGYITNVVPTPVNGYYVTQMAFLTQHSNPQSQATTFNYQMTNGVVQLQSVVDANGGANRLYYTSTNAFGTNLISQVTDRYGRSAFFSYDSNNCLASVVDVGGITNVFSYTNILRPGPITNLFSYETNFWMTALQTPYGMTSFTTTDTQATNAPPDGRSVLVTDPDGSSELYLAQDSAPGVAASYSTGVPSTGSLPNMFDNSNLNLRNTFHWGKKQYADLFTTNISSFTANDFSLAKMKHWLLTAAGQVGQTLSLARDPSPDLAGSIAGEITWYDYAGKTNSAYEGTQILPLLTAKVLPDSTTRLNWQARNPLGAVTTNITTFGLGSAAALRTNIFTYNPTNEIDLVTLSNALGLRIESNAFNSFHQVLTNYDALGEATVYIYDTTQRLTSATFPTLLVTTNLYGSDGFLAQQIKIGIATNSYTYSNALVLMHTDPLGLAVSNTWDNLQRLTSRTYPDGTYISNQYTRLDLTAAKDRLSNWTYYGFDALRHNIAVTNALNNYMLFDYCSCGALEAARDFAGNYTTNNYDNQVRVTNIDYPDGSSLTINYNLIGQGTNIIDGNGVSVTNWYNNQGLLCAASNAFGQVFGKSFDPLDRLTTNVDGNGVAVARTYDNLNRLLTRSYPDGGVETFGYSPAGLVAYTNQLFYPTYYAYDTAGRRIAETNALNHLTLYGYDGADDLTNLTDQNTNTTKWGYDIYGRVTNKVAGGNTILTYQYDADNRLTNRWSLAKTNTTYGYDAVGNLKSVTPALSFSYNAMNWVSQMIDGIGTTTFTYTQTGQLASETGPWAGDTISYTYNDHLRSSLTLQQPNASAWVESYGHDAANRLQSITSPAGLFQYAHNAGLSGASSSALVGEISLPNGSFITNTFDGNARMLGTWLYNSTGGSLDSSVDTYNQGNQRTNVVRNSENHANYTYDTMGEVMKDQGYDSVTGGSSRLNEQLAYVFDPAGNLNYRTNNGLTENFRVNSLNELTTNTNGGMLTVMGTTTSSATSVTVNGSSASRYGDATFAATNLPLTTSYTAVASDAYGRWSTNAVAVNLSTNVSFQYDGNGNLTNDGLRNFVYDDENELIQVSVSNQWMSQFSYDGRLRRRICNEYSWQNGAWVQTNEVQYVYDGNLVIQERDINNLPTVTYTRGNDLSGTLEGVGGIGGLLARTAQANVDSPLGAVSFYHCDANGNITMLIDSVQGIVAQYLYDAFGNTIAKSGLLADANVYRFSSKEWHQNSGLAYYLYRCYDPNLQRWLNRDPMAERGFETVRNVLRFHLQPPQPQGGAGSDLYSFVGNRAPNQIDIFGLVDCEALEKEINDYYTKINLIKDRGGYVEGLERQLERLENTWGRFCFPPPPPLGGPCPIPIMPEPTPPPSNTHNTDGIPPIWLLPLEECLEGLCLLAA
jgi:RHS repeat-associated protein